MLGRLPQDLLAAVVLSCGLRQKLMCSMLSRGWRTWMDDNASTMFAADLIVGDAGIVWKTNTRSSARQGEASGNGTVLLGEVDLHQWKGLQLKLLLAIGQAREGSVVCMPVAAALLAATPCGRHVCEWSITKVEQTTNAVEWGGSRRCDLFLSSTAAEVQRCGIRFELVLRRYPNPTTLRSRRTLAVLQTDTCLCCRLRRAQFFCFDDRFREERATCFTCSQTLMRSPLIWRSRFHIPEADMRLLKHKAGRVYQQREAYGRMEGFFSVRIRVQDVLDFYGMTMREFVCSSARRRAGGAAALSHVRGGGGQASRWSMSSTSR